MNGLKQYRSYQVETASPGDQIVAAYDAAVRSLDQALAALAREEYEVVSQSTGKAQRILEELSYMLDFNAGEIARNLWQLYDYWNWRLSQALVQRDESAYLEVRNALADMREAWAEVTRQARAQRPTIALG